MGAVHAACAGGVGAACAGRRGGGASPCTEGLQCSMEIRRRRGFQDVLPCRAAPGKPRLACSAVAAGRAAASRPRLACRAAAAGIVVVWQGEYDVGVVVLVRGKGSGPRGGLISEKAV